VTRSESFVELRQGAQRGWVREDFAALGLDRFWQELELLPGAKGRGGVGTLHLEGCALVVRPYRRGGWFARVLGDRYASPLRARDELRVLGELRRRGVPVVAPVAAVARRRGLWWQLRLCTERLDDASAAPQFLADHPDLRRRAAAAVAATVRAAFAAGLRHPDLHLDNVLCLSADGAVRAALVDLDRARLRAPLEAQARDAMLARMLRYTVKHRRRLPAAPTRAESMRFLVGLGIERAERHALWRRLAAQVPAIVG
jgi:3-deoxy-D-manno-octulosonic acid kinase